MVFTFSQGINLESQDIPLPEGGGVFSERKE